ncbi:MAG TPA: molybdate ABC transporter substrate-binding protein [Pyrinomonadaceae bacterium]|nr:molybdate ABC transporter substrate-binding protein [Pyrinomonadaceae bacterium]
MLSKLISILAFATLLGVACSPPQQVASREITVAAAADLAPAFEELGRAFEQQTQTQTVFSFGSTGMLAKQIEHGAPFDLFAAANVDFVVQLERLGLIVPDTRRTYARGRITLWRQKGVLIPLEQINDLTRSEVKRIAIANPEHAPYGMAAREALQSAGIWEAVKPKLVYGENVRQTLQFAQTGNVDVALVALSLSVQSDGDWVLIPEELHKPLDQALAVIKTTKQEGAARQFSDFIFSPQGEEIMRKYGFIREE